MPKPYTSQHDSANPNLILGMYRTFDTDKRVATYLQTVETIIDMQNGVFDLELLLLVGPSEILHAVKVMERHLNLVGVLNREMISDSVMITIHLPSPGAGENAVY